MEKWSEATRPLVTVLVVFTVCFISSFLTIRFADQFKVNDVLNVIKDLVALAVIVVTFWFGQRTAEKANEQMINQIKAVSDAKGTGIGG